MFRYIFLLAIIPLNQCRTDGRNKSSKDQTVLFRTCEHNLVFSLKIDNEFTHYDSLTNKNMVLGYSIGTYKKKQESSLIYLRINEKDTIFKCDLFKFDSILFGLTKNRNFYIITNHDRNAWIAE